VKSILLVDDEPQVVSFITAIAKPLGYQVESAKDGAEALWLYEMDPNIDALITDVRMPGMDGFELAKTLRVRRPDLPVLIISGFFHESPDIAGDAFETHRNHYLAKPFSKEQLIKRLEGLFAPTSSEAR
jgi:CheY-like chemotaxis protein